MENKANSGSTATFGGRAEQKPHATPEPCQALQGGLRTQPLRPQRQKAVVPTTSAHTPGAATGTFGRELADAAGPVELHSKHSSCLLQQHPCVNRVDSIPKHSSIYFKCTFLNFDFALQSFYRMVSEGFLLYTERDCEMKSAKLILIDMIPLESISQVLIIPSISHP